MTTDVVPEAAVATDGKADGAGSGGGSGLHSHRVLGFARAVDDAFDRLGEEPAWSMTEAEQAEALRVMARLDSRLAELRSRVLVAAVRNEVDSHSGATSMAAWLGQETRQTRARCYAAVRLAEALDETYDATRRALGNGRINEEQAEVVVKAVDTLTRQHDDLTSDIHLRAEAHMLELAEQFDAAQLRRLGKRLFEVVCPEGAEAAEGEALAEEEERACRSAYLTTRDNGDGTVEGRFRLPVLQAALLKKSLQALTSPRRLGEGRLDPETGRKIPYEVLLGQGFMELLENHLNPAGLPSQGGSPFTLVVTIGIDALRSGVGAGTLETGERISAGAARRLACQAGIIPAVLGGDSVVLDMGRQQRLFDRYQRIAMAQRFGGCATDGCDRPPSWTEAHHANPWRHGGRTDLADGLPLCPPHHHMADRPDRWHMRTLTSGRVRFSRRQ